MWSTKSFGMFITTVAVAICLYLEDLLATVDSTCTTLHTVINQIIFIRQEDSNNVICVFTQLKIHPEI